MKFKHKFDRYIAVTFLVTIVAMTFTSYITFKEIINAHKKEQHSAIVPLFSLVTSEILRPLNVANFMVHNQFIIDYAKEDNIDEQYLAQYLERISSSYNMLAFVALEKHGFMIDSKRKKISLTHEDAEWFHRLKVMQGNQFTDIGNLEDPHLYFDSRLVDNDGKFLGFTGVGIDLNYFAQKFKKYRDRFGFELYFVDENNIITLSSNEIMRTESHHRQDAITRLENLPWYQSFIKDYQTKSQSESTIMHSTAAGLLISEMPIQELNWRMFIVSPPASEQNAYWRIFITRFIVFFIIAIVLYLILLNVISYLKSRLIEDTETDFLTKLPNRGHIYRKFDELKHTSTNLCVVIADVDNFKVINDTYGHLVGDDVLRIISEKLSASLRKFDAIGRWGGEEFIMLLPDTSAEQAKFVVERIRKNIEAHSFDVTATSDTFTTTVSFGICERSLANSSIKEFIASADKALYQAKSNGRNQTVIFN